MKRHIIYIPGLGDSNVTAPKSFQGQVIKTWRLWGVQPHLFQINWADNRPFDDKIDRLIALIDELSATGSVDLVCASAGATAALNVFAQREQTIGGIVCICGKINNPDAIGSAYKTRAPSFWTASQHMSDVLSALGDDQRSRILSIRAMVDPIVPARDSKLHGATNRVTWTSGHAITIGTQLLFGAPFFLKWLKNAK